MLKILKKNLFVTNKQSLLNVCASNFAKEATSVTQTEADFATALPYDKLPGPGIFGLVTESLPGGKYYNLSLNELVLALRFEFGSIARLPGILGQKDIVFSFDENDVEKVFRNEGRLPVRRGLDSLEYYRKVHRPDLFKTAGLVPEQGEKWYDFRTKTNQVMLQPRIAKMYVPALDEIAIEFVQQIRNSRDAKNETPADFLESLNRWSLESIGRIALDTRLGVLSMNNDNEKSMKINKLLKVVFTLSYEFDIQPSIWRIYKTPCWGLGL